MNATGIRIPFYLNMMYQVNTQASTVHAIANTIRYNVPKPQQATIMLLSDGIEIIADIRGISLEPNDHQLVNFSGFVRSALRDGELCDTDLRGKRLEGVVSIDGGHCLVKFIG